MQIFEGKNKFYKAGIKDPLIKRKKKAFQAFILIQKESPRRGIEPPVSRVTRGDTHHYNTEEVDALNLSSMVYEWGNAPSHFNVK